MRGGERVENKAIPLKVNPTLLLVASLCIKQAHQERKK